MPITRDILLPITFTCVSQFNFMFIWRPRKLNSEVDWMLPLFICKFSFGSWVFLCLLNNINFDLFTFNVNLLADNYKCALSIRYLKPVPCLYYRYLQDSSIKQYNFHTLES